MLAASCALQLLGQKIIQLDFKQLMSKSSPLDTRTLKRRLHASEASRCHALRLLQAAGHAVLTRLTPVEMEESPACVRVLFSKEFKLPDVWLSRIQAETPVDLKDGAAEVRVAAQQLTEKLKLDAANESDSEQSIAARTTTGRRVSATAPEMGKQSLEPSARSMEQLNKQLAAGDSTSGDETLLNFAQPPRDDLDAALNNIKMLIQTDLRHVFWREVRSHGGRSGGADN